MGKKKVEVSMVDLQAFIQASIKETVNGKVDKVNAKLDMVGEHLKRQDLESAELKEAWNRALFLLKAMGWTVGAMLSAGSVYLMGYQILQTLH